MEHTIILCSAKCLSNSGLVSGAMLKNCDVDHSSWNLVTGSPAMELAQVAYIQLLEDWLVGLETVVMVSACSVSVGL